MDNSYKSISLPSKCLPYKGIPEFDPAKVELRTFKGKDEKLVAELSYDNFDRKFLVVMRNVIKGIDAEKLTVGDRLYVMVWEAINSYTKDFDIEHTCMECFEKITSTIDLSKLEVIELPDDFKEPYPVKLSNGDVVQLRLFRVDDEMKIADYEKADKSSWLYRFATAIVDEQKGIWDRVQYLENLDVRDMAVIRAFHDKFTHGPKMESDYICPKCGGAGKVQVPFRLEMLFPYGEILRKHFGNAV